MNANEPPMKWWDSDNGRRRLKQYRQYTWGISDQLTRINDQSTGTTNFEHDKWGNLATTTFSNGEAQLRNPNCIFLTMWTHHSCACGPTIPDHGDPPKSWFILVIVLWLWISVLACGPTPYFRYFENSVFGWLPILVWTHRGMFLVNSNCSAFIQCFAL